MFKKGHNLEEYYISALTLKRIERAFKRNLLDGRYKSFKFHILYLAYQFYMAKKKLTPSYNFENVINDLNDQENCSKVFKAALNAIIKCLSNSRYTIHDAARSKAFTDSVKQELKSQILTTHVTKPSSGRARGAHR